MTGLVNIILMMYVNCRCTCKYLCIEAFPTVGVYRLFVTGALEYSDVISWKNTRISIMENRHHLFSFFKWAVTAGFEDDLSKNDYMETSGDHRFMFIQYCVQCRESEEYKRMPSTRGNSSMSLLDKRRGIPNMVSLYEYQDYRILEAYLMHLNRISFYVACSYQAEEDNLLLVWNTKKNFHNNISSSYVKM